MNVYFVYKVLTNRIRALIIAAGYISPGPLREFRTASDERAGPGNEAGLPILCTRTAASFPGSPGTRISPRLHNFNVRVPEHGSLGTRLRTRLATGSSVVPA